MSRMVLGFLVLGWIVCVLYLPQTVTGTKENELTWLGFFMIPIFAMMWAALIGAMELPAGRPVSRRR